MVNATSSNTDQNIVEDLRAQVRDLRAALRQDDNVIAVEFSLPPYLANILGLMLAVTAVTPAMLRQRLDIATDAKVAVHRLRHALAAHDITIHSRRNVGYWLDLDTKERVKRRLECQDAVRGDAA